MNKFILGLFGFGAIVLMRRSKENIVLSDEQEAFINNLHDRVKAIFRKFIYEAEKTGWKVIITSGYRTFAKQLELKQENANNAAPGSSWHNYGMAIDINLEKSGVKIRKVDAKSKWELTGIPALANKMGLTWGGNFATYHDPVHFDVGKIINTTTSKLKQLAFSQFGTNWANIHGNKVVF